MSLLKLFDLLVKDLVIESFPRIVYDYMCNAPKFSVYSLPVLSVFNQPELTFRSVNSTEKNFARLRRSLLTESF